MVPPVELKKDWTNPPSRSKSSIDEQPASRDSPTGSPPTNTHNLKSITSHSAQSEYFPAAENRTSPPPPLPASPSIVKRDTPPSNTHGPRNGQRSVSKGGGVQMVLTETGSWSELANHGSTMPATDGTNGSDGSHKGSTTKQHGMLSFLSRRGGRERSPKPKECGVLGKEGARVVINSGKWGSIMLSAKFSSFLCFYTLITKGAWRPVSKRGRMFSSFFQVCLESGHPTEKSASISFLRGTGWGKSFWWASRKRENRGVKFIGRLNMRFLLHIITTQQGTFFARLVLSIIKSVQVKPSRPLEIFTYSKDEELGPRQGDINKGGAEDGEKGTEIWHKPTFIQNKLSTGK